METDTMRLAPIQRAGSLLEAMARLGAAALKAAGFTAIAIGFTTAKAADGDTSASVPVKTISVADYRSYLPETHSVRKAMRLFAQTAQARSEGRLRVELLPGSPPGSPADQIRAVREGKQGAPKVMLVAATGLAELDADFALFDLPYAVVDEQRVDAIIGGEVGRDMLSSLAAVGLIGLGWMENGFRQITTTDRRIRTLGDFHGLRVRALPTTTSIQAFEAWRARPVSIPASQVGAALRTGTVEAQEGFVSQILQSRLHEVQRHLWLTHHSYGAQVLIANARFWRTLDASEQRWLQEAAWEAARQQRAWAREETKEAMRVLASRGMAIEPIPVDTKAALAEATQAMRCHSAIYRRMASTHSTCL